MAKAKKVKKQKVGSALKDGKRTDVPERFSSGPRMASEAQTKWILDMLNGKDLNASGAMKGKDVDAYVEQLKETIGTPEEPRLPMSNARELIDALKDLPWKSRRRSNGNGQPVEGVSVVYEELPDDKGKITKRGRLILKKGRVLAGSYGVKTPGDEFKNDVTFFKVWINEEYGRGWGVQMYVSDDTSRVRLSLDTQLWALKKIAKNPEKASRRFGLEFKRCGVCGRGLTNDLSRALGIGPVCRERI